MQIVSGAFGNLPQKRAVHPVYDRAVQFSWSVKPHVVLIEIRDKNVLYLKIPPRVKQRQGIVKTLERSGTQMKPQIARRVLQNILKLRGAERCRKGRLRQVFQAYQ